MRFESMVLFIDDYDIFRSLFRSIISTLVEFEFNISIYFLKFIFYISYLFDFNLDLMHSITKPLLSVILRHI